jgi:hypothetical protein
MPRRGLGASRRLAVMCVVAAIAASPRLAIAGESDFHAKLKYEVYPSIGCWEESDFKKKVGHRLGYEPFRDDAPTSVSVQVDGEVGAIGGNVTWQDAKGTNIGERHFVAKDGNCGKLLAEMAFAIALQIQMLGLSSVDVGSDASAADVSGEDSTAPESNTEPTTETKAPPPPPEEPRSRPPIRMWLGIGPQVAYGIAPSMVADGRIFFGLRRGDFSVEVGAETNYPRAFDRWDGSGFRELLLASSLALCHHQGPASACLLGKAGELRVTGLGLDVKLSPAAFVAHAGARLGAALGLSKWWFLGVHVDGLLLLTPCTIQIDGSPIWEMPRIAAFAGIDIAARFR